MTGEELKAEILRLRELRWSWDRIGDHLGMSYSTARERVDPEYAARRRARQAASWRRKSSGEVASCESLYPNRRLERVRLGDLKARFAEIPPDTRDKGARLMGDPILERSALYQRMRP